MERGAGERQLKRRAGVEAYPLTASEVVDAAMDEFDELGRDPFLAKYGHGHAKRYVVRRDGRLYDSKAIAGVAVGFQYPDRGPMLNSEFSGGEGSVVRRLGELGFEIVDTARTTTKPWFFPR